MVRRYYTPELANRSLPLVRRIAQDARDATVELERQWAIVNGRVEGDRIAARQRLQELEEHLGALLREFEQLGIELKDPRQGLLDFRARQADREVYLCWRLGEERITHWHEIEAGFGGRRPIETL